MDMEPSVFSLSVAHIMKNSSFLQAVVSVINKALNSSPVVKIRIKLGKDKVNKESVVSFITSLGMEWFIVLFCQEKSNIWLFRRIPEGVTIPLPKGRFKELKRNTGNFIKTIPEIFVHLGAFRAPIFCPTLSWQRFFDVSLGLVRLRRDQCT